VQRDIKDMHTWQEWQEGRIELNVGGKRFETSVQTLCRASGSLFDAYFSGRYAQDVSADGGIFIDRDGDLFGHVLEFIRDGVISVAEQEERPRMDLLRRLKREFEYFRIALYAEQVGEGRQADLFDTLIAVAAPSQDVAIQDRLLNKSQKRRRRHRRETNLTRKKKTLQY
jgi:hypothetical protein